MVEALISGAISGGIFGAIASLWVPWSKWGVEKRRDQRKARAFAISELRNVLHAGHDKYTFLKTQAYFRMREYLHRDVVYRLEGSFGEVEYRDTVLADTVRLEREWKLL